MRFICSFDDLTVFMVIVFQMMYIFETVVRFMCSFDDLTVFMVIVF